MLRCVNSAGVLLGVLMVSECLADPPPPQPIKPPGTILPDQGPGLIEITPDSRVPFPIPEVPFGKLLRDQMLQNLPSLLMLNRNDNWGHQAHVKSIQGLRIVEVLRNHGDWEKLTVKCLDVPHRLHLRVDELFFPARDRIAFLVRIELPADLEFTKQTWQNGLQLYVGHSRARVRFRTDLVLETGLKLDENGGIIAHDAAGFRIARANGCCFEFATEYVNGLGGDLAAMSGRNTERSFKHWQSSLEREVSEKVQTAFARTISSPVVADGYDRLMKTIASQDQLGKLLSTRAPVVVNSIPVQEGVVSDDVPRGRILMSVLSFSLEMMLNGRSGGTGGSSGGHSGGSSVSSHESHSSHETHSSPSHKKD